MTDQSDPLAPEADDDTSSEPADFDAPRALPPSDAQLIFPSVRSENEPPPAAPAHTFRELLPRAEPIPIPEAEPELEPVDGEVSRFPQSTPAATVGAGGATLVTLWGGPASGKTTFLGALSLAVEQAWNGPQGNWTMAGDDEPSKTFLAVEREGMIVQRMFTAHTEAVTQYSWTLRGEIGGTRFGRKQRNPFKKVARSADIAEFKLIARDAPGEAYGASLHIAEDAIVEALLHSQGLIYLFDPTAERRDANSFKYVNKVLESLKTRASQEGKFLGARLPHHIAVCVAKFDDPAVTEAAFDAGVVGQDRFGQLTVPPAAAEAFFDHLCETVCPTAKSVRDTLRANFHDDRRLYFTTSSVGLRQMAGRTTGFDTAGPSNVNTSVNGESIIQTTIRPINVLEPVLELERLIRGNRPR